MRAWALGALALAGSAAAAPDGEAPEDLRIAELEAQLPSLERVAKKEDAAVLNAVLAEPLAAAGVDPAAGAHLAPLSEAFPGVPDPWSASALDVGRSLAFPDPESASALDVGRSLAFPDPESASAPDVGRSLTFPDPESASALDVERSLAFPDPWSASALDDVPAPRGRAHGGVHVHVRGAAPGVAHAREEAGPAPIRGPTQAHARRWSTVPHAR